MSLVPVPTDNTPAAEVLANGFILETNQSFEAYRDAAYDAIERFWYRNGSGTLTGAEPSGLDIMNALGTNAEAVYTSAVQRATMVVGLATALGHPELIEMTRIVGPYDLTFNADGSLDQATLRS